MSNNTDGYASNGSSFQTKEVRVGMSLNYVAEKLRFAIESMHAVVLSLKEDLPDDFPIPDHYPKDFPGREVFSPKFDIFMSPAESALCQAITAYLALYNVLNLPGISDLVEEAPSLTRAELKRRLDKIASEGSTT